MNTNTLKIELIKWILKTEDLNLLNELLDFKEELKDIKVLESGQRFCPRCGCNWDGDSILKTFIKQREDGVGCWQGKSDEEIEKIMKEHYSPPYCWGREIGIELPDDHPDHYDGISYWKCPDCNAIFNRFTGVEQKKLNINGKSRM